MKPRIRHDQDEFCHDYYISSGTNWIWISYDPEEQRMILKVQDIMTNEVYLHERFTERKGSVTHESL